MPKVIALIPTRSRQTWLGLPSMINDQVAGSRVIEHTLARVARVPQVHTIVLVHPDHEDPLATLDHTSFNKPVTGFAAADMDIDPYIPMRQAARKWALTAWRGGLGGATCYDELLPARPLLAAMEHHQADAALLLGSDWLLVDPGYSRQVLDLHLENPDAMQMTFTQAPPGLAGIAVNHPFLQDLADNHATIGHVLRYNPLKPQGDPIGRDVCVQIPATVRGCLQRFIYDTPPAAALIRWLADQLNHGFGTAAPETIAQAVARLDTATADGFAKLPQQVTLELTPRRPVSGPVVPQHHVSLDRQDIPLPVALNIVSQLGVDRDTVLTLGGLGDALLYEHWLEVVERARRAGVLGIAIETDLLVDHPVLEKLLAAPIDVISVRLNADQAETYAQATGGTEQDFATVTHNLQWLLNERNRRAASASPPHATLDTPHPRPGIPWLIPRLIKTRHTLGDIETFFDRWMHFAGHAVIEPATPGCGLTPELSPVRMAPPKRSPCRQLHNRMTIHSDGRVALCDQDWLARAPAGDAATTPLSEIWQNMQPARQKHEAARWDDLNLCASCHEWHRP